MKETTDFAKYLGGFFGDYLTNERGVSKNTIKSYSCTFILLLKYMNSVKHINANRLSIKDITKPVIVDFENWLQNERQCCDATRNQRLAAICSFVNYIEYMQPALIFECQQILSIPTKKTQQETISYLTFEGIKLVLQQPDVNKERGLRDLALLSLMYESAARVSELIELTPASLSLSGKPYSVKLHGKGDKYRTIPLPEKEVELLRRYMTHYKLFDQENSQKPLFQNYQGRNLSRNAVNNILTKYVKKAKCQNESIIPEGLSCHSLRHSKAMELLDSKIELIHIRDFLGHKSVVTTERYARANPMFTFDAVKNAYKNITFNEIPIWEDNPELINILKKYTK